MAEIPSTSRQIQASSFIPPTTTGKSLSQSCPLALLAQTCSRIAPNLVSSVTCATTSSSSNVFQLNSSNRGSSVKIAPAPSQHRNTQKTNSSTILLSKDQNRNVTVGSQYKRVLMGQNNKESSFVPTLNPVKIPVTLVGPFYACIGAGQIPTQKPPQKSDSLIGSQQPPDFLLALQNTLTKMNTSAVTDLTYSNGQVLGAAFPVSMTTQGNVDASASESQPLPCINIMPPEALTAKMLQAVPPRQQQMTSTHQNIEAPSTNDNIQTSKFKMMDAADDATVQIIVPPNMTPESLQKVLVLAAQTAQKYQNAENSGPMLIQGQVDTSSNKLRNVKTTIPMCSTNSIVKTASTRNTNTTPRKVRTPCRCPNCIKLKSTPEKNTELKKRLHVCCFPQCRREFTKTSHLRAHIRTHTGERPYVCDVPFCDRKFTRSDELLRHRRTHGGVKKFKCNLCSKMFMRSDHLTKHRKTHAKYHSRFVKTELDK